MRKFAMGFFAVAAFTIILSGCDFNLFSAVDTVDVPGLQDLRNKAASDAPGLISDVHDYIDSGAVTEDNSDDIVTALEDVYTSTDPGVAEETKQEAAVLAGEVSITSNPDTKEVVDNVISALVNIDGDSSSQEILSEIFPADLSREEFYAVLDDFETASDAYIAFADSIVDPNDNTLAAPDAAEWMDGGEIGTVAQYAAVAIIAADIRTIAEDDDALYDFIYNGAADIPNYVEDETDPNYNNPIDTVTQLSAILDLANISLQ